MKIVKLDGFTSFLVKESYSVDSETNEPCEVPVDYIFENASDFFPELNSCEDIEFIKH